MEPKNPPARLDPEQRYEIEGRYDRDGFEDDVKEFPHLFDENGWPRFGAFDPYALVHPITGLSWHLAPRVSVSVETDPDYTLWYELAMRYESEQLKMSRDIMAARSAPHQDSETDGALYKASARKAVLGNRRYLRSHLLPRLEQLISKRIASPELAILWGDFCATAEATPIAVHREVIYHKSAVAGGGDNRDAQVKFYLHWRRRHCDELSFSAAKANRMFINLVADVVSGRLRTPTGFDKHWFELTQKQTITRDEELEYVPGLATCLTRSLKNKRAELLIQSAPGDPPLIPPIDRTAYEKSL